MTIEEYQEKVDVWIKTIGVRYFNELTNTLVLVEEVGELSRLVSRKYGEQSFKRKEDEDNCDENIKDELADIFFVLTCLSNQMGIDVTEILDQNLNKKTSRDIDRHTNNPKLK